jgi:hypothetical protein
MSFMAVFDSSGRCKYVLDGSTDAVDVSDEAAVVYMDEKVDPNTVWYDHASSKMVPRTPFRISVSQNKIERIPADTVAHVGSDSFVASEGSIEFEVDYAQKVVVTLLNVRHLDTVVEVQCEAEG